MNQEDPSGQARSSLKTTSIVVAIVLALAAAVLIGMQFGPSRLVGAASSVASSSAPVSISTPTFESAAVESPGRPPSPTNARPVASVPTYVEPVTQAPAPETFAEVQPGPVAPPVKEAVVELPVVAQPSPTAEPTCPADNGVSLTITNAELTYSGGGPMEEYKLTFILDNRIAAPVAFTSIDVLELTSVREDGAEMGAGTISLPETYEVPPGRTTFTTDAKWPATVFRGFGSPVMAFKLSGEVRVNNTTSDQNSRVLYCEYKDIAIGPPLLGNWGT